MNIQVPSSAPVQTLPQAAPSAQAPQAAHKPIDASSTLTSQDQLLKQIQHDKTKNMIVGISTITGMMAGAGTMLASRSTTGMVVGMGIMGLGLMSGRIASGKDIGSGLTAYVGGAAALGVGAAVGVITKKPLVGGLVTGAAVLGVIALSKSLEEK